MQRKFIAFLIFLAGAGIFFLGMLKTNLSCDKTSDICMLSSSIPVLNMNLDNMTFKLSHLKDVECVRKVQAARGSGRRAYYELSININNETYLIETCPNYKICKRHANNILDYKNKDGNQKFDYVSSIGVSNIMGIIMGAALIILGIKMFFAEPDLAADYNKDAETE